MFFSLSTQRGMVLLVSLVFMLLLSLTGLASMVSATQQEKMAAAVQRAHHSFQAAEAALNSGESWLLDGWVGLVPCTSPAGCNPPAEARSQVVPALDPVSGVLWVGVTDGLYGMQNLGPSVTPGHFPVTTTTRLYRVTGIGLHGQSRTVLESVYARYQDVYDGPEEDAPQRFRRVMWRQLQ